jgi:hypothetical protein
VGILKNLHERREFKSSESLAVKIQEVS